MRILNFNRKGQIALQSAWAIIEWSSNQQHQIYFFLVNHIEKTNKYIVLICIPLINVRQSIFSYICCLFLLGFASAFHVPVSVLDCHLFLIDCMIVFYLFCTLILCQTHCPRRDFKTLHSKHFKGHQVQKLLSGRISELFPTVMCPHVLVPVLLALVSCRCLPEVLDLLLPGQCPRSPPEAAQVSTSVQVSAFPSSDSIPKWAVENTVPGILRNVVGKQDS